MEKLYLAVFWKSTCSSNPFSYPHSSDSWHNTVNICNHIIKSTITLQNNCLLQLFITVISLANTSTLILKLSITSNRASLTVDFAVASLVLPKGNHPLNSILTEQGRPITQHLAPTGYTVTMQDFCFLTKKCKALNIYLFVDLYIKEIDLFSSVKKHQKRNVNVY